MHFSDSIKIITRTTNTVFPTGGNRVLTGWGTQAVWEGEGVSVRPLGQVSLSLQTGDHGPCPAPHWLKPDSAEGTWHCHPCTAEDEALPQHKNSESIGKLQYFK